MPLNGFGIFMIVMLPFLFVTIIIILNVRSKNAESKRRYDLYSKSLEMGQTVPEHFFDEPKKDNPTSNLKKGILWFVIGLALVFSFLVMHRWEALIVGIVPAFVGVGYLLVHFLEKPKTDSTGNNNEQHG
jgi:Flp pilus assembly protein TadB